MREREREGEEESEMVKGAAAALLVAPTVCGAGRCRVLREAWLDREKDVGTSEYIRIALDAVARGDSCAALEALHVQTCTAAATKVAADEVVARLQRDDSRGMRIEASTCAVALLLVAIEANVTGPDGSFTYDANETSDGGGDEATAAAAAKLAASGEELIGRAFGAVALASSISIFDMLHATAAMRLRNTDGGPTTSCNDNSDETMLTCWWYARATVLRQRLLGGRSAHLYALVRPLFRQSIAALENIVHKTSRDATDSHQRNFWRDALAACHIEAALCMDSFGYADDAGVHLRSASSALGLDVSLRGAMGTRTIYQTDEKAQLVLRILRTPGVCDEDDVSAELAEEDEEDKVVTTTTVAGSTTDVREENTSSSCSGNTDLREMLKDFDMAAEGVMEAPRFSGDSPPSIDALRGIEQVLVLAMAVHVRREQSGDDMQRWEMAPYVEAMLTQHRLVPLVRRLVLLLQARHEKLRPRTRERSIVHMQEAADAHAASSPSFARRVWLSFSVWFPTRLQMQKELGESLISMGLVGEGMRLFETMELWDSLISCYILLGKRPAGEALVKQRLQSSPDDPRLMNSLGDLTGDPSHYERAWEASGGRNVRSMRSLARHASRKKEWTLSRERWEKALRINPIHTQGWFELGYACMQLRDTNRALQAFTRCTQLDGSNAHAWNNIAALSIQSGRMDLAYSALNETVKHSNEDWHMWLNLAHASVKTRNFGSALRALNRVMDLTNGTKLDVEILEWMMDDLCALRGIAETHTDATAENGSMSDPSDISGNTDATLDAGAQLYASTDTEGGGGAADIDIEDLVRCLNEDESDDEDDANDDEKNMYPQSSTSEATTSRSLELVWQEKGKRGLQITMNGTKALLKRCMDSPVANGQDAARLWNVTSRYYTIAGEHDVARECLLKQLRAHAGSGWRDDEGLFHEYARASFALAASAKEQNTRRALAAARMHIRGFLKQATEDYGNSDMFRDLSAALEEVTEMESKL